MVAMSGAAGDCPLDPEHYNTTCECTSGHTGIPACDTNNYTISTIHCEDDTCSTRGENGCSCTLSLSTKQTSVALQCCSCPCLFDPCDGVSEILGCSYYHMSSATQPSSTMTTSTATIISIILPTVCVIILMTIISVTISSLCIILYYRRQLTAQQSGTTTQYVLTLFDILLNIIDFTEEALRMMNAMLFQNL